MILRKPLPLITNFVSLFDPSLIPQYSSCLTGFVSERLAVLKMIFGELQKPEIAYER
jgi:hypothetical protein